MSFIASSRDGLRNVLRHAPRHSLSIRNASSSASSSSAIAPLSSPPQVTLAGMKPRHIYRRILRHAHSIAKRWKDPFIFWTVKHLAMRNLGYKRGFEGNVMLPWIEPESWQTPPPKERPKYVIQITSQTDTERTFIAYKRLQRLCRQVANADRGTKPEMWKLLKQTYALAGPNMYMAKKVSHNDASPTCLCTCSLPSLSLSRRNSSQHTSSAIANPKHTVNISPPSHLLLSSSPSCNLPLRVRAPLSNTTKHGQGSLYNMPMPLIVN